MMIDYAKRIQKFHSYKKASEFIVAAAYGSFATSTLIALLMTYSMK